MIAKAVWTGLKLTHLTSLAAAESVMCGHDGVQTLVRHTVYFHHVSSLIAQHDAVLTSTWQPLASFLLFSEAAPACESLKGEDCSAAQL